MTSTLYRAIHSDRLRLMWPNLPPLCLCEADVCRKSCGRERVPSETYKRLLSKCGSHSRKVDIHFYSSYSTQSPCTHAAYIANQAHVLVNDCVEHLEDLVLHVTISSPLQSSPSCVSNGTLFPTFDRDEDSDKAVSDTIIRCCGCDGTTTLCRFSGNKHKIFPKLSKLLINLEYDCVEEEIQLRQYMTGTISVEVLKIFGLKLENLSIFTYHLRGPSDNDIHSTMKRSPCRQNDSKSNSLGTVCPLLTKLELYGCNLHMFCHENVSETVDLLSETLILDPILSVSNGSIFKDTLVGISAIEIIPLTTPLLRVLEVEENFEESDEIFSVFRLAPQTTVHIVIMGNTLKFLVEIFDFISTAKLSNTNNLEILEIHDFSPWPFCDERSHVSACTVEKVFMACPNLNKIIMSTVFFTDESLRSLASNFLVVKNLGSVYSTEVTRSCKTTVIDYC